MQNSDDMQPLRDGRASEPAERVLWAQPCALAGPAVRVLAGPFELLRFAPSPSGGPRPTHSDRCPRLGAPGHQPIAFCNLVVAMPPGEPRSHASG